MTKGIFVFVSGVVCFSQASCAAIHFPEAKLTVRVVDQSGVAVTNAKAKAYFYEASSFTRDYLSDTNGIFVVEGRCDRSIGGGVEKDGFYEGGFGYGWGPDDRNKILNRWEPWNPAVTAVLKEICNPVPMVYKSVLSTIPVFDEPVGFDFEKGDWVSPYGTGISADFVFIVKKIPDVLEGVTCDLSFSSEYDGIMPYTFADDDYSSFKWPYEAPASGYTNSWSRYSKKYHAIFDYTEFYPGNDYKKTVTRLEDNLKDDKEINYIFRVRSKVDGDGNLLRACYGKIEGEIRLDRTGGLQFRYLFNPDWTPNLEDDYKRRIELD